jgi:large subunit ribosomal protein L13e
MKHNNALVKNHFRKDWQSYVKTWFDQPAKKAARIATRVAKAKKLFPRPTAALRPVVRGQTNKYNKKVRAGRGFTIGELKAAGIVVKEAAGLAIAVDHRRKNRSQEGMDLNVARLKAYKAKVVVLKSVKKDEKAALLALPQVKGQAIAIKNADKLEKARAITPEELAKSSVVARLRQIHGDAKFWSRREKKAAKKAADKALADKKAAKKADE